MTCEEMIPRSRADMIRLMQTTFKVLPYDYYDEWSGCKVTFSWGPSGGAWGLPELQKVPKFSVVCGGKGEPAYDVLRKALVSNCIRRIPAPAPKITSKAIFSAPDPSTAFQTTPTTPLPAPAKTTAVPAPTTVPVTKPTISTALLQEAPSMSPIGIYGSGFIGPTSGPVVPTGFSPTTIPGTGTGIAGTVGGPGWQEWIQSVIGGTVIPAIIGGITGGETETSPGTQPTGFAAGCPTGYEWDGTQCVKSGIGGWVQRTLPGGQTGVLPGAGTGLQVGGGIMPGAVAPEVVAVPTSRCPRGMVLGWDGWCYHKRAISNKQRKWPRGAQPLLTGGEMKTLRRAKTLESKVKRAWQAAGKPGQTRCRRK